MLDHHNNNLIMNDINKLEQKTELLLKYREKIKDMDKHNPLNSIIKYTMNSSYGFFNNIQSDEKIRQFKKALLNDYNMLIEKCETFLKCRICFSCFKTLNTCTFLGIGLTTINNKLVITHLISGGVYGYYCPKCMKSYCEDCFKDHKNCVSKY